MSQENVEIVRAAIAAWNRGDLGCLGGDVPSRSGVATSGAFPGFDAAYYGHNGVRSFWRAVPRDWQEISLDVEEIIDRGEQVIVLYRVRAKGRDGIEFSVRKPSVYTVRGGQDRASRELRRRDQALEAIGLSE